MSLLVNPLPVVSPVPSGGANQQRDDQTNTTQTDSPAQSDPAPVRDSDPVAPSSGAQTNSNAGRQSPAETGDKTAASNVVPLRTEQTPASASPQSVFEARSLDAEPKIDEGEARRNAEAAREAYEAQSQIDDIKTGPDSAVASLPDGSEAFEKPVSGNQPTNRIDAVKPDGGDSKNPYAKSA